MKTDLNRMPHLSRPDADNLMKFIGDAMTGIIWKDDETIAWTLYSKSYTTSKLGSTTIYAVEIPNAYPDYELISELLSKELRFDESDDYYERCA